MTNLCEKIWNHMMDPRHDYDMIQTALEGNKPELAIEMLKLINQFEIVNELAKIRIKLDTINEHLKEKENFLP